MGLRRYARRIVVISVGIVVTGTGMVLMPVPGPGGTPVFIAGLVILSTESKRAKSFLTRFREAYANMPKGRRRLLTTALCLFYVLSGVAIYMLAKRG